MVVLPHARGQHERLLQQRAPALGVRPADQHGADVGQPVGDDLGVVEPARQAHGARAERDRLLRALAVHRQLRAAAQRLGQLAAVREGLEHRDRAVADGRRLAPAPRPPQQRARAAAARHRCAARRPRPRGRTAARGRPRRRAPGARTGRPGPRRLRAPPDRRRRRPAAPPPSARAPAGARARRPPRGAAWGASRRIAAASRQRRA